MTSHQSEEPARERLAPGLHYVMNNGDRLFFGQHHCEPTGLLAAYSSLARSVLRAHLFKALDALNGATSHVIERNKKTADKTEVSDDK